MSAGQIGSNKVFFAINPKSGLPKLLPVQTCGYKTLSKQDDEMFKQLLASVGIGASKIDTQLQSNQCAPGGRLQGQIQIQGGAVAQQINGFDLA